MSSVFNLQPLGGTFWGFEHLYTLHVGAQYLSGKRFSLALCLLQRLAGYGRLSAGFAKAVDFRGLPVQVTQPFLCVANIARQGFTRGLDGLTVRVAWSTAFSKTSSLRLLLIVVSATLQRLFAPCDELGQAQGIEI